MSDGKNKIVYVSCTEAGFEVLRSLIGAGLPVSEIVSVPPEKASEHTISGYYSFEEFAEEEDISLYYPEEYSMGNEQDTCHFEEVNADAMIVNGWQRLIPEEILDTLDYGAYGVHGSAYGLPQGRGRSPLNWSLIEDLDRFLLSVIRLDAGIDSGEMVDTVKFNINDYDEIKTLYYKTAVATQKILRGKMDEILRGECEFDEQEGTPTYYPKRNPEDGGISWRDKTRDIYNLVRAVSEPYPGAFTRYEDEKIMIWDSIPFSDDLFFDAEPGEIVQVMVTRDDFVVKTSDGTLLVEEWEADSWNPEKGMMLESINKPDRVDHPREE